MTKILRDMIIEGAGFPSGVPVDEWPAAEPTVARYVKAMVRAGVTIDIASAVRLTRGTLALCIAVRESMIEEAFNPLPAPETEDERIDRVLSDHMGGMVDRWDGVVMRAG